MAATRITAHQIRLHPTPEQEAYLRRAAGTRRFVYNWGLAEWNQQHTEFKEGKREHKPTAKALKKAVPGDAGNGLSLDAGGDQVCHRGRRSFPE